MRLFFGVDNFVPAKCACLTKSFATNLQITIYLENSTNMMYIEREIWGILRPKS